MPKAIQEIAKESLEEAGDDVVAATAIMEVVIRKSPSLYRSLMDPLVRAACYDAIRMVCRTERRSILEAPQPSIEKQIEGVVLVARSLLNFRLPGGKRMMDATRDDMLVAASFYDKQSVDMGIKARWLRLAAVATTRGRTCGQVLTNDKLEVLLKEAC